MYKRNGNISINGLTPEMFESATDSILECSNLYKIICDTITKWKEKSDDSIVKVFVMFTVFINCTMSKFYIFFTSRPLYLLCQI